jgi:DNA uptake protein ComE-like DNA-binding protein
MKRTERGSVLIIVMWICLGLVALTLYFARSVDAELQAAANRAGDIEARQAAAGAMRYAAYILNNYAVDGVVPHSGIAPDPTQDYHSAALPIGQNPGDPQFWFIGRDPNNAPTTSPVFSLVDESSKLNLNTATPGMLELLPLPSLTADFVAAIVSWRSPGGGGGSANDYGTLEPPRVNKGAPFESTDELRLVDGSTLDVLLGEDTNRNGALDPNEDDGDQAPPHDNQDGVLQPGLLEYVTAFSNLPATTHSGGARTNIASLQSRRNLASLLTRSGISSARASAIVAAVGSSTFNSVAAFMVASGMTPAEFALVHTSITASTNASAVRGLVNVNTASATVLACIPGIGQQSAASLVAYRVANPTALTSFAWITQILSRPAIVQAGPYITDQSYQFSADIVAVGRFGRGYCREFVVFDTSQGIPRIIYRQDLSAYGWALGPKLRQTLRTARTD